MLLTACLEMCYGIASCVVVNKNIFMYVGSEMYRLWFSLRLWCYQGFYNDISPILKEIFAFKMGCSNSVLYLVQHLLKVIILCALRRL